MLNALEMKAKLEELKAEAQSFLNNNEVEKAEAKTLEVKILNAQMEIQEQLDEKSNKLEEAQNKVTEKETEVKTLNETLESVNQEKEDLMNKFTEATNKIAELNEQVTNMKPIVDNYNKKQEEEKLNSAKEEYQAKFDKVGGAEAFASEEIQNLIKDTISDESSVSNQAKFELSEKLMDMFDKQNSIAVSVTKVQEPAIDTKNLSPENDEFENVYGFKKQ